MNAIRFFGLGQAGRGLKVTNDSAHSQHRMGRRDCAAFAMKYLMKPSRAVATQGSTMLLSVHRGLVELSECVWRILLRFYLLGRSKP
ncbi:MAG: hypothetical protein CL829_01475 [Crocinitomicaceae bacterium]|nr:hypothetical protein [Crocinitomicaceae bacterium]